MAALATSNLEWKEDKSNEIYNNYPDENLIIPNVGYLFL